VKGEKNFSGKAEIQEEDEESPGPMEKAGVTTFGNVQEKMERQKE